MTTFNNQDLQSKFDDNGFIARAIDDRCHVVGEEVSLGTHGCRLPGLRLPGVGLPGVTEFPQKLVGVRLFDFLLQLAKEIGLFGCASVPSEFAVGLIYLEPGLGVFIQTIFE